MSVLVIAEHDGQKIQSVTRHTIMAGTVLGEVTLLVAGEHCRAAAEDAALLQGVGKVLWCDDACYRQGLAEPLALLMARIAKDYTHLLGSTSSFSKNLIPRVAALLDVSQVSDIIEVQGADTFVRQIYAGTAIATLCSADPIKVLTVRTTAFDPVGQHAGPVEIEAIAPAEDPHLSTLITRELIKSDRPELAHARVVVSGGGGLGSGDNFTLLETLADRLGGAVGASRAAVDAGYAQNDRQIGQTGQVVAPELYIAIGISGAIQHVMGMKDSKLIVAINKDETAPIFDVADYGLVGDLLQIVPELIQALSVVIANPDGDTVRPQLEEQAQ